MSEFSAAFGRHRHKCLARVHRWPEVVQSHRLSLSRSPADSTSNASSISSHSIFQSCVFTPHPAHCTASPRSAPPRSRLIVYWLCACRACTPRPAFIRAQFTRQACRPDLHAEKHSAGAYIAVCRFAGRHAPKTGTARVEARLCPPSGRRSAFKAAVLQ